ncbi:hypothetical protein, partial [Kosakonia radicincitans]|uniref:hypothetical protein n=1 Tax=Kosakonia radicincitans TaxID=283686 RepID=UPI00178C6757
VITAVSISIVIAVVAAVSVVPTVAAVSTVSTVSTVPAFPSGSAIATITCKNNQVINRRHIHVVKRF